MDGDQILAPGIPSKVGHPDLKRVPTTPLVHKSPVEVCDNARHISQPDITINE